MKTITSIFGDCRRSDGLTIMAMLANACSGYEFEMKGHSGGAARITVADDDYETILAKIDALDFSPFKPEPYEPRGLEKAAYNLAEGVETGASWVGKLWTKLFGGAR